jgi:RNA polymerase sigma factor (sigma-70 family)
MVRVRGHDGSPQDELAAVRQGDVDAFAGLFDLHAQDVYRYCVRRCDLPDAAEDLMSVVFLEAWRCRAGAVQVEGSLRPWLFGVARNVTRTARRSAFRHRAALGRFHASETQAQAPDLAEAVVERVDAERAARLVEEDLLRLPARDRDVAELCLLDQMSVAAAALVLGIPEGTVKSRLARVRRHWQNLLRTGENATPAGSTGHVQGERPPVAAVGGSGS